ncbi:MAG: hypothetical protein L0241_20355 [Planctomycetia bacterium]|nr:hypothetical protein [Planctomycetia bacterium]
MRFVLVCSLLMGLLGCGTVLPPGSDDPHRAVGSADPPWVTHRPHLPPPEIDRMNYDHTTRTLTLYNLPGNDRWMVHLPDGTKQPTGAQLRLSADVELDKVLVFYARPGVRPSTSVSVKQIQECGNAHNSNLGIH